MASTGEETSAPPHKRRSVRRRKSIEAGLGIPDIVQESIKACRKRDSDINGVILELCKEGRKFSLSPEVISFTGGLQEMCNYLAESGEGRILYCYLKVVGKDDLLMECERFICMKYQPDSAPVMLRAQSGTFDGQIQGLLIHHLKLQLDDTYQDTLNPEALAKVLMKNMGSDKPARLYFGSGDVWDVASGILSSEN